ncbi:MAG: tRNA1(Val) (adenine(37)-N6)-methyltransferase [Nitrospirota bacterium]|nr:tRNA1(Val) (adenine(37)-N6)-methyltransferase [Nitrospirota bacterium]
METTLDGIRDIKLYQNRKGYRFSVDALLLYSFVNVKNAGNIIDLGAGSGVIGLLLAKKYTGAKVLLLELQESLFRLAGRNIEINNLQENVHAILSDIKDVRQVVAPRSHDIIVSNPPFRKPESGRISAGEEKAIARHEMRLNLDDLADAASYLLKARGRFFMIFHPGRILEVADALRLKRLEPKRIRFVYNDAGAESRIVMIEAVKGGRAGLKIDNQLYIYDKNGSYTAEVQKIYDSRTY